MEYKVGDRVRIKSIDWYNENKDELGYIVCGKRLFYPLMSKYCGNIFTISDVYSNFYQMYENRLNWTDEMIEGLVEEKSKYGIASYPLEPKSNANCITRERVDEMATKIDKELPSGNQYVWELTDGYQFIDENGNVINATKIVLEKKKKEYPKTYIDCCKVLEIEGSSLIINTKNITDYEIYLGSLIGQLHRLIICRDAYWKLYGEEMGLGEPWESNPSNVEQHRYAIYNYEGTIAKNDFWGTGVNAILSFPTEEMQDAFYKNFKKEIEICKKLL